MLDLGAATKMGWTRPDPGAGHVGLPEDAASRTCAGSSLLGQIRDPGSWPPCGWCAAAPLDGGRAAAAAIYPHRFGCAICKGIAYYVSRVSVKALCRQTQTSSTSVCCTVLTTLILHNSHFISHFCLNTHKHKSEHGATMTHMCHCLVSLTLIIEHSNVQSHCF